MVQQVMVGVCDISEKLIAGGNMNLWSMPFEEMKFYSLKAGVLDADQSGGIE